MTNGINRIYLGESISVPDKGKNKIKTKILKEVLFGQAAGEEEEGWIGDVSSFNHFNYFLPFLVNNWESLKDLSKKMM